MALKKVQDDTAKDVRNVINEIEDEKMQKLDDTVVKDEDGIVSNVPLLAGIEYEGRILDTFSYREMNGRDEEAINKNEVRSNGAKFALTLIERCVFDIGGVTKKELGLAEWKKLIRKALSGDITYMLMKIRQLSLGDEVEISSKCPRCQTKLRSITSVSELEEEIIPFGGSFEIPFELPNRGYQDLQGNYHKTGMLRIPNGEDIEILIPDMSKNPASGTSLLLTRCMTFDDGTKPMKDRVSMMGTRDRNYLESLLQENSFGFKESVEVTCVNCGEIMEVVVGSNVNFF